MPDHKIYFAGSISGGRQDADLYLRLITHLRKYGTVLTEHIGERGLSALGEDGQSNEFIHDRDMEWLGRANIVVAEVTTPSLGVGYEIGRMIERNIALPDADRKNILCLYRPAKGRRLSAMISGSGAATVRQYQSFDEAIRHIDEFFIGL